MRWHGSEVQSILFDRSKWTEGRAKSWLRRHDRRSDELDTTDQYIRARQADPSEFSEFRTVEFSPRMGIRAVLGALNPGPEDGQQVYRDTYSGHLLRLFHVGEEADGFHRYRLYVDDEEVISLLWPSRSDVEVWESLCEPWIDVWALT